MAELVDPTAAVAAAADLAPLIPHQVGTSPPADAPEERYRLFDSASRFLRAGAAAGGLVAVLDDLHRADRPSVLLLLHLTGQLSDARLLLFATYRDTESAPGTALGDVLPDLVAERATERLHLRALSIDAVRSWLVAVAGQPVPDEKARRVHEVTGGIPFFVGELARHLRDGGELAVTEGVRGAIRRRLDRLAPRTRELLRAASVVGREFPVGVVAAMLDAPAIRCLDLLDRAAHAGIVEPVDAPGRYRFVHDLMCDAVEADLGAAARAGLHRQAARAIEHYYANRIEPTCPTSPAIGPRPAPVGTVPPRPRGRARPG